VHRAFGETASARIFPTSGVWLTFDDFAQELLYYLSIPCITFSSGDEAILGRAPELKIAG